MPELYSDFMSKQWRGLGVFKVSSVRSIFRTFELVQHEQRPQHVFRCNFHYNVVQHFLSQLKKTMSSLPLAFNTSNALEYFNQR